MLNCTFTERAVRDIALAREWYDARGEDLGDRFVDSVMNAVREAREMPQAFREVVPGVRCVGCLGFPYRIYYELESNSVMIRAVYHTSRDARRWDDPDRD